MSTDRKNKQEELWSVGGKMANRTKDLYSKPWVVKQGSAAVQDAYVTLALPLTMGVDGIYAPGAQVYSQFNRQNPNSALTQDALQFFCCIAEDGTQGTPTIHGLKRSDPRYGKTVAAIWRQRQGKPPMMGDRDLIRAHVKKSIQFCPVLANIYWKLTVRAADPKKWAAWEREYDQASEGVSGGNGRPRDVPPPSLPQDVDLSEAIEVTQEQAEAEERAVAAGQVLSENGEPQKKKRKKKVDYHAAFVRKLLIDSVDPAIIQQQQERRRRRRGDDDEEDEEEELGPLDTESTLIDRIDSYFITIPASSPTQQQQQLMIQRIGSPSSSDDDDDDSVEALLGEDDLEQLFAEVENQQAEQPPDERSVVGAVLVMFIKDKNFNPGQTLADIIDTWKRRQVHRAQNRPNTTRTGGRKSQYEEPYAHLYDFDDHFVWRASPQRLNIMMDWVYNTGHFTQKMQFISPLFPHNDGLVKNPAHPENMFTLDRALAIMKAYGGDEQFCNVYTWLNHARCGFNPLCYYKSMRPLDWQLTRGQHTWHYKQSKMIWGTNSIIGLAYEYFPHIDTEFEIEQYLPADHRLNALQPVAAAMQQEREEALAPMQSMYDNFNRELVVNGSLREAQKPITKELANINRVHWRSLQHEHNAAVIKSIRTQLMPKLDQLRWDSPEYQAYAKCMTDARRHLLTISGQFFFPNKQVLSESMNTIYEWFFENCKDSVGVFIPQYVYGMDVLANWWVLDGQMTRHDSGIVRYVTRYLVMHWAAHDVYRQFAPIPMHPGFWNYGPGKAGKSFVTKKAVLSNMLGNREEHTSSRRANNIDEAIEDVSRFYDELNGAWVDAKQGKRNPEEVERLKTERTDCAYRHTVFEKEVTANGAEIRANRVVETISHTCLFGNTNEPPGNGDEALESRFFRTIWPHYIEKIARTINIGFGANQGDKDAAADQKRLYYMLQSLIAMASMAQDLEILPEVSMDVFFLMSEKMVEYLNGSGVSHIDVRMLNLMAKVARVYTVLEAVLKLWFVAGAPFFQKPFHPEQLIALGPYLWCSKQCTLLTWTSCADYIFDTTIPLVLESCFDIANVHALMLPDFKMDQEYLFNHQMPRARICWSVYQRHDKNSAHPIDEYDFNYVTVHGTLAVVASKIFRQFNEKLDVEIIKAQLRQLSRQTITVKKWKRMPCEEYDCIVTAWENRNRNLPVEEREPLFDFSPAGQGTIRPECEETESHIPAVDIHYSSIGASFVRIAVHASAKTGAGLIVDAFLSCISGDTRPQNFITGLQYNESPGIFSTIPLSQEAIDILGGAQDEEIGLNDARPNQHFAVVNSGFMSDPARVMLRTFRFDPKRCYDEAYDTSDSRRDEAVIEIKEDLDIWVYKRHYLKNGYMGNPNHHDANPNRNAARVALAAEHDELFRELMDRLPAEKMRVFDNYPKSFLEAEAAADRQAKHTEQKRTTLERRKRRLETLNIEIDRTSTVTFHPQLEAGDSEAIIESMPKRIRHRRLK